MLVHRKKTTYHLGHSVQDPLALKILEGEVRHGDHVVIDADVPHRQMAFTVADHKDAEVQPKATARRK